MASAAITPDNDAIVAEVFIAAPPAGVFEAIVDPAQRAKWWGMKSVFRVTDTKSDLEVGGKWSNEGVTPDGRDFHLEGRLSAAYPELLRTHKSIRRCGLGLSAGEIGDRS